RARPRTPHPNDPQSPRAREPWSAQPLPAALHLLDVGHAAQDVGHPVPQAADLLAEVAQLLGDQFVIVQGTGLYRRCGSCRLHSPAASRLPAYRAASASSVIARVASVTHRNQTSAKGSIKGSIAGSSANVSGACGTA